MGRSLHATRWLATPPCEGQGRFPPHHNHCHHQYHHHHLQKGSGICSCSSSNSANASSRWKSGHVASVLVFVLACLIRTTFPCPRDCFCEPHSKNLHCANKGLTAIPEGIPADTVEMILNHNTFSNPDLTRRNFTDLRKLQKLYMSRCGIETIAVDTFTDLQDLIWLDISENRISYIADYTFRGLHLKHLFINDNKGIQLSGGAFEGMSTQGLYMHNCGMSKLPVKVMAPLNGTLRTLWLYDNQFETFSEDWLYVFNSLGHLRLGNNPFHCNCELGWLHKFFTKHSSVFSGGELPTCNTPALVRRKKFSNLTADDFRCQLPTFRNVDAVFDREMGKLTCQARGDPVPTMYWIRPDGTTETYYSPKGEDAEQNEGVLYMTNVKLTDSTKYKCVASNPAGNVTFSLNVVWPAPPTLPPSSPTTTTTTTATTPTTTTTTHPKGNVIVADATLQPGRSFHDDAMMGDKKAGGGRGYEDDGEWGPNRPGLNLGSQGDGADGGGGDEEEDGETGRRSGAASGRTGLAGRVADVRFTILDVVGAVVGTFMLTLLTCVLVAHLCWRRQERLRREQEEHYSVPDTKPPPLAPARLYIMGEDPENRVRMLGHLAHPECPT